MIEEVVDIVVVQAVMSTGGLQGAHLIDMAGITLLPQGDLLMVEGQEGKGLDPLHILHIAEGRERNGLDHHLPILLTVLTGLMQAGEADGRDMKTLDIKISHLSFGWHGMFKIYSH